MSRKQKDRLRYLKNRDSILKNKENQRRLNGQGPKKSFTDRTGEKYGEWTIISFDKRIDSKYFWICKCSCGTIKSVSMQSLNSRSRSCGCKRVEKMIITKKLLTSGITACKNLYRNYKANAKNRNLHFDLSLEVFENITKGNCVYCGTPPLAEWKAKNSFAESYIYNGIDRKDNAFGYTEENCVPCCAECNFAKGSSSEAKFKEYLKRVYLYYKSLTNC